MSLHLGFLCLFSLAYGILVSVSHTERSVVALGEIDDGQVRRRSSKHLLNYLKAE